ncbi:MAG: amidohydrolase family protein [Pseudomonadota bacterium]|nr:amidohydrolase family protein [Pseudomonadota bacterium]
MLLLAAGFLTSRALAGDLLLTHARLWDGTGAPVRTDVDVLVHDDRIVAVGPGLVAPEGARVLDVAGGTVMPGLIDAHVHLSLSPGAAWRKDTPEEEAALLRHHLRAYLACGVTTILDPAVLPDAHLRIRVALTSGAPGPTYLALGAPFSPPGGYVQAVLPTFPSVGTPAEVARQFDTVEGQGVVGIKTTVEEGFGPTIWPTYTSEVFDAIRTGAAARGVRVYAHAASPEEQTTAIERLGATVLVHPPERYDRALVALAAARGVYEMSTLAILDTMRTGWAPERLADPLLQLTVPAAELATAADPEVARGFARAMVETMYPGVPAAGLLARLGFNEGAVRRRLARTGRALRALRDAGVPIVMGSDSGNWPIIPFEFHGPTSVREVELLVLAGLTPEEALLAATRTPARMLAIEAGTVESGRIADLLVVDGDPLVDVRALRHLRYIVRAGEARTPGEWMGGESGGGSAVAAPEAVTAEPIPPGDGPPGRAPGPPPAGFGLPLRDVGVM